MSLVKGAPRPIVAAWVLGGIGFAIALSGCESIREATGAAKTPPDEFTVLTKSPLVIPPDFNLRPPQPGIASRNDPDADETGGSLNQPQGPTTAAGLGPSYSDGEKLLLTKTNALSVDPNIRKTITTDVGLEDQGPAFAQKVLFQGADAMKPAAMPSAGAAAASTPAPPPMTMPAAVAPATSPAAQTPAAMMMPAASTPAASPAEPAPKP